MSRLQDLLRSTMLLGLMLLLLPSTADRSVWASTDEYNLIAHLFEQQEYNRFFRPVRNKSEVIYVSFEMALIQIITLDERNQLMKTNIWLRVFWEDFQLRWEPSQFGGINYDLRIHPENIWTPDVVLFNNADGNFEVSFRSNVLIGHNGTAFWIPCSIYKSSCTFEVKYFPFDEQRCNMSFGSWTYNGDEVQLRPYIPGFYKVSLDDFEKSDTWDVVGVPVEFETWYSKKEGHNVSRANYTIVMRRKTLFYTVNLIMPCFLISILSMVVFYLPATAGEKITMSVSIFLALIVFLQVLVSNLLPPSSLSFPLFARFLIFALIVDVCCIVNAILSLNWSWRTPRTHVLSPAMRTFFFKYVAGFLRMTRPADKTPSRPHAAAGPAAAAARDEMDLTELHHMDCPYARMSRRRRSRVLDESGHSAPDELRREYNRAIESVRFVAAHLKNEDDFAEVIDDWQFMSLIFDRLLFYVYGIVLLVGTLTILMNAPYIFTKFDQLEFKRGVYLERCCKEYYAEVPLESCYQNPPDKCRRY